MKKFLLSFAILSIVFGNAQNIFQDDFSTYNAGEALNTQGLWSNVNNASNGFYGGGACIPLSSGGSCLGSFVTSTPIGYPNFGTSSKSFGIAEQLDGIGHPILPKVTSGDLYLGLVLNLTTAPTAINALDFLRVVNSDLSLVTFRLIVREAGTGYNIGIRKGASNNTTIYSSEIYNFNEDNLVILKYSHLPSGNDDILNLYVNSIYTATEPALPTATTSSGFDQSGDIDRVFFRLNYNPTGALPNGIAGLVSTSTTWAGLGFLPLSVNQFEKNNPITIISNNAKNGFLNIKSTFNSSDAKLNIYTLTGSLIEKQTISINDNNNDININPITTNGIYIVEITEQSGEKYTKKITIN